MSSVRLPHLVIQPKSGWRFVDWRELVRYRDLFWFLSMRDVTVRYKQTVMGFGWAIIRPVASMVIFSVVFGRLARMPSDGIPYPLFCLSAMIPWTYFSTAFTSSSQSLVSNAGMLKKVYFPRVIIPLTPVLGGLIDFGVALIILALLMPLYGIYPGAGVVVLPLLIAIMMIAAAGLGLWLSALAVQYRDVSQAMPFVGQILMYAAPVVWPVTLIVQQFPNHGESLRLVYGLYPMAGVIEGFRAALLNRGPLPWDLIGIGAVVSIALLISGVFYFRRLERIFADVA
ncbi:MAG TPA: ABC transporter permease [Candidatus Didemnitutus sp.]|nr:ABC transporter permease [Candidatus Didemnitutus sp.]